MALVAAIGLAIGGGTASAVTLMVNADTPSIYYQRYADRLNVPTYHATIALRFGPCPDLPVAHRGCYDSSVNTIWIESDDPAQTLSHELGHAFDDEYLTDAERDEFRGIWSMSPPWRNGYYDGANELFARAYSACGATYRRGGRPFGNAIRAAFSSREPATLGSRVRASCRLIDAAGTRAWSLVTP